MVNLNEFNELSKILVVDDIPKNIQIAAAILEQKGYEIGFATNGKSAIEKAKSIDFDLILLDVMMPEIDGFEVCRQLKKDPKIQEVPIIFLTAKTDLESVVKGFELGAVDYITKPFNSAELLARVKNHIDLRISKKNLKKSNEELEQFASVIAHDLKNPISSIISYLQIIEEIKEEISDNDVREMNTRILQRSNRLIEMINELLSYSRISGDNSQFNYCDANEILYDAMDNLYQEIETKKAKIIYDNNLPKIWGNEIQLRSVFQNLINNALKYCDKDIPEIKISCIEKDTEIIFSIKDNGIGIDPKNFDKIFMIFYRLHPNEENYSGSGIGLSYIKKIIQIHNGRIWLESELGKGSEFHFSIPKVSN